MSRHSTPTKLKAALGWTPWEGGGDPQGYILGDRTEAAEAPEVTQEPDLSSGDPPSFGERKLCHPVIMPFA